MKKAKKQNVVKKAIIFDLDGTLINSIPFHLGEHIAIFKKIGIKLTPHFFEKYCNGTKPDEFYRTILLHYTGNLKLYEQALALREEVFKHESYAGIRTFLGVHPLLRRLKKEGFKLALASSSGEKYIHKNLSNNKLEKYFDVIVGSSHVKHSKPNPFIFNLAFKELSEKFGMKKSECVVVEDATNGVIAAKRAKIDCICLLTSESRRDIPKSAVIAINHSRIYGLIKKL
ncbi:MAG: HAD family phosphatase [Candidatus Woesearchaeota archaeon]